MKNKHWRFETGLNSQRGLSILEVIISTTIILVGIISIMILFDNNFHAQQLNVRKLVAYNLAKEGIEIVRWSRDSYWFTEIGSYRIIWGAGGPEEVVSVLNDDNNPLAGWEIQKEGSGSNEGKKEVYIFYDAASNKIMYVQSKTAESFVPSSWVKTVFKRSVFINKSNPDGDSNTDDMQIISRVEYAPGKFVELEAFLYNWY